LERIINIPEYITLSSSIHGTGEHMTYVHLPENTIRVQQNIDELKWLINHIVKLKPKIILEIGIGWLGFHKICELILRDTYIQGNKNLLIGIDKQEVHSKVIENLDFDYNKVELKYIVGQSQDGDIVRKTSELLGGRKIDFLFIDGDHSYELAKEDFINYSQFVRKGGLIGFHDISGGGNSMSGGPSQLFYELKGKKEKILGDLGMGTGVLYL